MPESSQPVARIDVVTEERFGVRLADPYRWMEAEDAESDAWLTGQGDYATAFFRELPDRAALLARIGELTTDTNPEPGYQLVGESVFQLAQPPGADVPVLTVRSGTTSRVLLDPATLPGDEHNYLDWFAASPDGRFVACGISQGGSEQSRLRVVDVERGTLTDDTATGTFRGKVSWLPGSDGLLCLGFLDPPPDTPADRRREDGRTILHRLGTAPADDVVILARGLNPNVPLTPVDRPYVLAAGGSSWLVAIVTHSATGEHIDEQITNCSIYIAPREVALADPAGCPWQRLAVPEDRVTAFAVHGDDMYVVTDRRAPRGELLAVSLAKPDLDSGTVLLPGGERALVGVRLVGPHLLVHERDAGVSRFRRVPLDGGEPAELPVPVDGALLDWVTHPSKTEAYLTLNSWTDAPCVYRYDGTGLTPTDWLPPASADFSGIVSTDLRVPARDGTLVPLRVLHKAGLALDGGNPTLLTGYGSYGLVNTRLFAPEMLAWYERGGVHAIAGLRGGGEYGEQWHLAGRGPNKENTITDLIDCAEYLIREGYTSPARLAGDGVSAGGIPSGGSLVRRPDLWAAMIMRVPVTNSTRSEFSENGPINAPEFGSVTTEAGLRDLLITDCYLRVEDGTPYPSVLITAGRNDPRVVVWQPGKMAARLQAATSSGRPVVFRVDPHAGHGMGSTRTQRNEQTADILAFLWQELGMTSTRDTTTKHAVGQDHRT